MDPEVMVGLAKDGSVARSALTDREQRECASLDSEPRQGDFRAGRLAAKRAALALLGPLTNHEIDVRSSADSPPRMSILGEGGRTYEPRVELSISHRNRRAVAAIAPAGVRVGVDFEVAGSVPGHLARHFLARSEEHLAERIDVTLLWSFKEAAWKALGLRRSVPLKGLELSCDPVGRLLGVRLHGAFLPMSSRVTTPWPGYHMVMVWTGREVA